MLKTLHLDASNPRDIARAAELLRAGGTVAFPTETVYGLGANALSGEATARIFRAKERPSWDPLIVHVPSYADLCGLTRLNGEISSRVDRLAAAFWPGPLTLLLPRSLRILDSVTAGRPLVGVRIPAHEAAQALLHAAGLPLAAPSANRFGHTSPTTARHVLDDLDGRIDAVLDGGATRIGLESSVLDPTSSPMVLYRPGSFTDQQLAAAAGVPVTQFQPQTAEQEDAAASLDEVQAGLPAPGVGLRHYAPRARLILTGGSGQQLQAALREGVLSGLLPEQVGVVLPQHWQLGQGYVVEPWAEWNNADALAARLFFALRALDARGVQVIYCPLPDPGGLREAIRDRLRKAAKPS